MNFLHLQGTYRLILSFIGGFVVGGILVWGFATFIAKPPLTVPTTTTVPNIVATTTKSTAEITASSTIATDATKNIPQSPHITVLPQNAGPAVTIQEVTFPLDGWVVVHEERGGYIGNALGAIRKNAGTYTNLKVSLLRTTQPGTRYWVVLYSDNGDHQFNLRDDFPIRDANSNPVTTSFVTHK